MHIDKKLMRRLFLLGAGCILFAWLVLDTARASALFTGIWELIAPFVTGAAIAFIFNVPMRAIENQLEGIRRPGLRRVLSILLTLAMLALIITFVVELLVPQIRLTVNSLTQQIPAFVEKTAADIVVFMDENPEVKAFVLESLNLESIEWSSFLKQMLTMASEGISSVGRRGECHRQPYRYYRQCGDQYCVCAVLPFPKRNSGSSGKTDSVFLPAGTLGR